VVPLLLGLSNKGTAAADGSLPAWGSFEVGGLLLIGTVLLSLFVLIEARARQPIVPLTLFRDRTFSASIVATLAVAVGMFAAIIYLPRFYQVVRGVSATQSGYEIWPLLVGLMGGSILGGQLISRTGRYKILMLASIVLLIVGGYLMTHLQTDTNNWTLWAWMLIVGAGIGPGMAAYTVVIQSVVPLKRLGVATSTLTLLRQLGGSVSLAIAGTLFNSTFTSELPARLSANGVPAPIANQLAAAAANGSLASLGGAGQIAQSPQLQALVPKILAAVHEAETFAIAQLFWLTIGAAVAAFVFTLVIREEPLRSGPALRQEQLDDLAAGEGPREPAAAAAAAATPAP
jgi:MFS family permease